MRALGKGLTIAGALSAVIGLGNILSGWQMDDLGHAAFLLILNGLLLVLPGAGVVALGRTLRNGGSRRHSEGSVLTRPHSLTR